MRQFTVKRATTLGLCSAALLLPALALGNTASPVPVFKPVPFPATDEQKRQILASPEITVDGKTTPIGFNAILRSGDKSGNGVFGQLLDSKGMPIKNQDGSEHISVDNDFSSLIPVGDKLFMVSHFESRPGAMYLTELNQDKASGKLSAISTKNIDMAGVGGLWVPCAGSVTPWMTHLGSEEYPNNARLTEAAKTIDEIEDKDEVTILNISGTELRRRLAEGLEIPEWFSFPEVVKELRRTKPPRSKQGFTVFFTGFSGSGKSTIANALLVKLMEMGGRPVTLLDGDIVRKNLSSELGFSKEHRDLNIRRIGYVASEITKNGGIAICAPIAPYATTRRAVREDVEEFGAFIEVHVATSIEECERRDRKGLYKLAREGKIKEFTGISDPYDVPANPELSVETENVDVDNCAHQVILKLESMGLIAAE